MSARTAPARRQLTRLAALPWHPFLLAVYPPLFYYAANRDRLAPRDLAAPLLACGAAGLALWAAIAVFVREPRRAALLTSPIVVAVFAYGPLRDAAFAAPWWPDDLGMQRWVAAGLTLAVAATWLLVVPRVRGTRRPTAVLNAMAAILVLTNVVTIVAAGGGAAGAPATAVAPTASPASDRPDVYHLVLDGHAAPTVLRDLFGQDGPTLADDLEARGFFVADAAIANYATTFQALAATLGMRYVDEVPQDETAWHVLNDAIADNAVLRAFDARGYTTIHFRSGKGITDRNPHADVNYRAGHLGELATLLVEESALAPLAGDLLAGDRRRTVLRALERLPDVAQRPEPTYAFAHLLVPHPPFVFAADGAPASDPTERSRAAYLDQVEFVRRTIVATVDAILATSEAPPVVVIHSDHGPSSTVGWDTRSPQWQPEPALVRERMQVFFAVFLPGADAATLFGDRVSPVNTFRLIFAELFGADLRRLPDRAWFSTYAEPFRVTDVTPLLAPGDDADAAIAAP